MLIGTRTRIVDGTKINCCRECVYCSQDKRSCAKKECKKFDDSGCPPKWCPYPKAKRKYTDIELLDWLQEKSDGGSCLGVINDDDGRWAVSFTGMQHAPSGKAQDLWTTFNVERKEWKNSVRDAIVYAIEKDGD